MAKRYHIEIEDEGLSVNDATDADGHGGSFGGGLNDGVRIYIADIDCAHCRDLHNLYHVEEEVEEDAGGYTEDERDAGLHRFLAGVDLAEEAAEQSAALCDIPPLSEDEEREGIPATEALRRRLYFHRQTYDLAEWICATLNAAHAAGLPLTTWR